MINRKYQSVKDINSRTDGKGVPFACEIRGENTKIVAVDRSQRPADFNGKHWNQLVFTISFEDTGFSMCIKAKDTHANERMYVTYGSDLYEQDSKEEFYKICLLIAKQSLKSSIHTIEELHKKYLKGEHSWPLTKLNVKSYLKSLDLDKRTLQTIDIEDTDLIYLKQYTEE